MYSSSNCHKNIQNKQIKKQCNNNIDINKATNKQTKQKHKNKAKELTPRPLQKKNYAKT